MRRLSISLATVGLLWACAPGAGDDDVDPDADAIDAHERDPAPLDATIDGFTILDTPDAADAADAQPPDAQRPDAAVEPPGPDDLPAFAFPITPPHRQRIATGLFFGVDHDPADGDDTECLGYAGRGFPSCYDGHEGSDFVLSGGFDVMDDGSALIVAAAGGTVVDVVDGNYDRCHGTVQSIEPDCDGHPRIANRIIIEHAHGWSTRYLHLKRDSPLVRIGQTVECGDPLGLIGSSGRSFTPHLHFEVRRPDGTPVDPFAGVASGPQSLWVEQRAADRLPGPECDPRWRHAP